MVGTQTERDVVYETDLADDTDANREVLAAAAMLYKQRNEIAAQIHDLEKKVTRDTIRAHSTHTRKLMQGEVE